MTLLTEPTRIVLAKVSQPLDADAQAYVNAVEVADRQRIEDPVRFAINNFVIGCKADGIWTAIKASCILAGARTLAGALVPLVGAAPTNVGGLFVSGDYNRKTGLVGDGSTKYLNSNRNNNADPQNSRHLSAWISSVTSLNTFQIYIGTSDGLSPTFIARRTTGNIDACKASSNDIFNYGSNSAGFIGVNRPSGTTINRRNLTTNLANSDNSTGVKTENVGIFAATNNTVHTNARIAFYSIGESLDLALLDARVTTLINAFAAAIP